MRNTDDEVARRDGRRGPGRRRHVPFHHALHVLSCLALVLLSAGAEGTFLWPGSGANIVAQEAACTTSGPDSGVFVAEVCLTTPHDGATLTDSGEVTATVAVTGAVTPAVEQVQFFFTPASQESSNAVLRDYAAPFTFTLPTARWTDRTYRLEVQVEFEVEDMGDFTTPMTGVVVTTANEVTRVPTSTGRWAPHHVEGDDPIVLAAVGDGAGGLPATDDVAGLIEEWDPAMLLYLGDVYNVGSYTEFLNYYDPTLGRMKEITNPVPGDHEGGRQFQGYLDYWDTSQHYYTATAGSWRLLALNSTDRYGQYAPGTGQFEWLRRELAADDDAGCTMVYLHNPRWGLHTNYDYEQLDPLWHLLVTEGVDLVLTGHEHNYQRWEAMDATGVPDPTGTMEMVVGTGGHDLISPVRTDSRVAVTYETYGALRLELREGQATYQFVDVDNTTLDSGSLTCSGAPLGQVPSAAGVTGETGRIVNTGGIGVRCRVAPDQNAEIITVLPEGMEIELRGPLEGDWQPVRCAERDGYIHRQYLAAGG